VAVNVPNWDVSLTIHAEPRSQAHEPLGSCSQQWQQFGSGFVVPSGLKQ
jgi:hypothetical protein